MRYKFENWHLIVIGVVLLLLYQGGYLGFLGALISPIPGTKYAATDYPLPAGIPEVIYSYSNAFTTDQVDFFYAYPDVGPYPGESGFYYPLYCYPDQQYGNQYTAAWGYGGQLYVGLAPSVYGCSGTIQAFSRYSFDDAVVNVGSMELSNPHKGYTNGRCRIGVVSAKDITSRDLFELPDGNVALGNFILTISGASMSMKWDGGAEQSKTISVDGPYKLAMECSLASWSGDEIGIRPKTFSITSSSGMTKELCNDGFSQQVSTCKFQTCAKSIYEPIDNTCIDPTSCNAGSSYNYQLGKCVQPHYLIGDGYTPLAESTVSFTGFTSTTDFEPGCFPPLIETKFLKGYGISVVNDPASDYYFSMAPDQVGMGCINPWHPTAGFKLDIKNYDFKVEGGGTIQFFVCNNGPAIDFRSLRPGTASFNAQCISAGSVPGTQMWAYEIEHSKINTDAFVYSTDGIQQGTADISYMAEPWLLITGGGSFTTPRYQKIFACELGPNEMLGYEMFSGPQALSLFSTRYPVVRFCESHPAILIDPITGNTDATPEINQRLIDGGTYNIQSGSAVGLFYVFNAQAAGIAVTCPEEFYDVNNNRCTDISGLATICSEGTYDPAYGTCVATGHVVCPYDGRYDRAQNLCIYNPQIQYICAYGDYYVDTGRCEYVPEVPGQCPAVHPDYPHIVYTWDDVAKTCYSVPASQIICPPFYGYDSVMEKCIMYADSIADCKNPDAAFEGGICSVDIPSTPVCPADGWLSQDLSVCYYEPSTEHQCLQGGLYDEAKDICIIEPDYDYLCVNGEYLIVNNQPACQIVMDNYYVCKTGFKWDDNTQKCIQEGGVITPPCETDADCDYTCIAGDEISGTCTDGRCYIDTSVCPKVPGISWWDKLKVWLIEYMLYIMLFLMALLLFIMVVARGKFLSAKNLETFGRKNVHGLVIGLFAGAIFSLLALELNPISWVSLWTIISGGLLGCIVDALWKPKI